MIMDFDYSGSMQAISSKKPTIRIKRLSFSGQGIKLKGDSSIREER